MRGTFIRKCTHESSSRAPSRLYHPAKDFQKNFLTFLGRTYYGSAESRPVRIPQIDIRPFWRPDIDLRTARKSVVYSSAEPRKHKVPVALPAVNPLQLKLKNPLLPPRRRLYTSFTRSTKINACIGSPSLLRFSCSGCRCLSSRRMISVIFSAVRSRV